MNSRSRLFAFDQGHIRTVRTRMQFAAAAVACLTVWILVSAADVRAAEPAPAWEPVAGSGPTNLPPVQSEIQRVAVDAEGGTYTLTATTASGSGSLSFDSAFSSFPSGATQVEAFFGSVTFSVGQTVSAPFTPGLIAPGTTIVAVGPGIFGPILTLSQPTEGEGVFATLVGSSKEVTGVSTTSGAFQVGDGISGTGIPAGTTITSVGPSTLTLSANPTQGGVQTLTATETTTPIAFDAEASEVAASLNALAALDGTTVKGGQGNKGATSPYFVTFGGNLADINLPEMGVDSSGLTGGDNHMATITTVLDGGPGTTEIAIYSQNVGGASSSGETTLSFTLPAGVTTTGTPTSVPSGTWSCDPAGAGQSSVTCTASQIAAPGTTLSPLRVPVIASPDAASGVVHVEVSGGGTLGLAEYDMPLAVSAIPAPPGMQSFTASPYKDDGTVDNRAGAHPYSASTGILVNTVRSPFGTVVPVGEFRDIVADTPPGFIGNPIAAAQCPEALEQKDCPQESIVATLQAPLVVPGDYGEFSSVNNIEAPFGFPAKFRTVTGLNNITVNVVASLRSDEDYGLEVGSYNTPQIKPVFGAFFTIWGEPVDPGHDPQRCERFLAGVIPPPGINCMTADEILAAGGKEIAFLTNPVDCEEEALRRPVVTLRVSTWDNPADLFFGGDVDLEPVKECENLEFDSGFDFEPDHSRSDSPASFETEITVPSEGLIDPDELMTPTIKETVVDLPKGVVLNASAADGLQACSEEQIGLIGTGEPPPNRIRFKKDPNTCPDASKIGTGELKSELLEDPLKADIFLAEQGEGNPFGSLFAIYLVVEDPRHGIFIKLPGEVRVNEQDGQQRIVFKDLPPLPFTYLKLTLKGGSRSPLASPTTCGTYTSTTTNTPWSAPESKTPGSNSSVLTSPSTFHIDQGPSGGPCAPTPADRPFNLDLNAGVDSPVAGGFTPFTFQITRPDGAQEIDTLELTLPPGLAASLKGVAMCSDAAIASAASSTGKQEQGNPACPAASQVGRTLAGAGSGPTPFYAPGKIYLAGPYKGAPVSVVTIAPAVAGPFDLGNVVVRAGIYVNRSTAQVTAKVDPIPQILKGVPLRVRDIRVFLDRPNFALNPTNCSANAITAKVTGNSGAVASLSEHFQVAGCENLGFKPRISLSLKGGTKRGDNPALTAIVQPRPGDANIARASVTLPRSAFLDQSHIRTVCTRVQFSMDQCPKAAIYGFAIAETPLLDYPVQGPVYLRSSNNELPDLVADLRGPASQPIQVEAAFRTDSIRGGIRSTLDVAPDAPVTKFTLKMQGGKKGLVVNSQNICQNVNRANARLVAQNNLRFNSRPKVVAKNCGKARSGKRKGKRAR